MSPMLKKPTENSLKAQCDRCAFVMLSDSSSSGFRCGYLYFEAAPIDRKPLKMDHYPEVQSIDACGHWCAKTDLSPKPA